MPFQREKKPYYEIVLVNACMYPLYYSGFAINLTLMFSKGSMVTTCPQPEAHPVRESFKTSTVLVIYTNKIIRYES